MGLFTNKLMRGTAKSSWQGTRTLAVTLDRPKTAALAFDYIYAPTESAVPGEFTPGIVWATSHKGAKNPFIRALVDGKPNPGRGTVTCDRKSLETQLRFHKDAFYAALEQEGYRPIEFLNTVEQTYAPGDVPFVFAILKGIVEVDENHLFWEQVREFRKDKDANLAYKALIRWFDKECKGWSRAQIEDHLILTLESGQNALKKHGVVANAGGIATLAGTSAALWFSQVPTVAAISTGVAVIGGISWMVNLRLQRKENRLNGPLAYVQKLDSLPGIRTELLAEHRALLAAGRDMVEDL